MKYWVVFLGVSCAPTQKEMLFSQEEVQEGDSDADLDGYLESEDCDDAAADINPGAVEVCDDRDNNCNGEVDDDSAPR